MGIYKWCAAAFLASTVLAMTAPIDAQTPYVPINRRGAPIPSQNTGRLPEQVAKDAFARSVEARLQVRQDKCVAAFPDKTFCTCLNAALPLEVEFERYVALVSASPEQLTEAEKALRSSAVAARDRCVAAK